MLFLGGQILFLAQPRRGWSFPKRTLPEKLKGRINSRSRETNVSVEHLFQLKQTQSPAPKGPGVLVRGPVLPGTVPFRTRSGQSEQEDSSGPAVPGSTVL